MNHRIGIYYRYSVTCLLTSAVQTVYFRISDAIELLFVVAGFHELIRKIQNTSTSTVITKVIEWEYTLPAGTYS